MKKLLAIALSLVMLLSLGVNTVFAASSDYDFAHTVVDTTRDCTLDIWKYDLTAAAKPAEEGGINWQPKAPDGTPISADDFAALRPYAIQGVVFTMAKVADLVTYSEQENGAQVVKVLYAMDATKALPFLQAIGLTANEAYPVVTGFGEAGKLYFEADTLIDALKAALAANSTTVKNALENYMVSATSPVASDRIVLDETDVNGHTHADIDAADQGLYLVVETHVPEQVISLTDPFLVCVPMTSVNGANANDGGERWIYDIKLYPKNQTGEPEMQKTVREAQSDTGVNNGSSAINDGYDDHANASAGDKVEYQIIFDLPVITSDQSRLTQLKFVDTLSKGIEFNGNEAAESAGLLNGHFNANDVVIEFFIDADCTQKVATWRENDEDTNGQPAAKFTARYAEGDNDNTVMTIFVTDLGLSIINKDGAYEGRPMLEQGYSRLHMRVTYSATLNQNADLVLGDEGNPNDVVATWSRTNTSDPIYNGTIEDDDTNVYAYGIALTKEFSDGQGNFSNVSFKLHNDTDNYFVIAQVDPTNAGVWYVKGHTTVEAEGTDFVPAADGKLVIYGLEADTYTLKEMTTDNGYTLLKDPIVIVISEEVTIDDSIPENEDGHTVVNMSATVDGKAIPEDTTLNAGLITMSVLNQKGFDLPRTGGEGTMLWGILGIAGLAVVTALVVLLNKKRKKEDA